MSDSWRKQLERDRDGRVVELFVPVRSRENSDLLAQVGRYVPRFRNGEVPLGYVAEVTGKAERTVRRMAVAGQIPGCRRRRRRKSMRGYCHFRIANDNLKFWEWLDNHSALRARDGAELVSKHRATSTTQENTALLIAIAKRCDVAEAYRRACDHLGGPFLENQPRQATARVQRINTLKLQLSKIISDMVARDGRKPTLQQVYEELAYTDLFRAKMKLRRAKTPAPWASAQGRTEYKQWLVERCKTLLPDFLQRFQRRNGRQPTGSEVGEWVEQTINRHIEFDAYLGKEITNAEIKRGTSLSWSTFRRHYAPVCRILLEKL